MVHKSCGCSQTPVNRATGRPVKSDDRAHSAHIRQFVRVRQALVDAEALGASSTAVLENTSVGVIQLNRIGKIVAVNDRALEILKQGDGLLDRGGFLRARLRADNDRFLKLLSSALPAPGGNAVGGSMTVRRSPHLPRLALHVNPVTVRQMDLSALRGGGIGFGCRSIEPAKD